MFILTFSWLLHFLYLFNYVQLSIAALPGYNTELGIRRNAITRQGRRTEFIVYTSVVEYENSVDQFTDEQIAGLAHQAWDEMKAQHQGWADSCQGKKQEFVQNHRPSMMSAIAIGKEIYFASSMKANSVNVLLKHQDSKLSQWVNACRMDYFNNQRKLEVQPVPAQDAHRRQGNCGEILASALYLQKNKEFPWETQQKNNGLKARVIAFGTGDESIQNPCSAPEDIKGQPTISCKIWVKWQEMKVIRTETNQVKVIVPPKAITNPSLQDVWTIQDTGEYI